MPGDHRIGRRACPCAQCAARPCPCEQCAADYRSEWMLLPPPASVTALPGQDTLDRLTVLAGQLSVCADEQQYQKYRREWVRTGSPAALASMLEHVTPIQVLVDADLREHLDAPPRPPAKARKRRSIPELVVAAALVLWLVVYVWMILR